MRGKLKVLGHKLAVFGLFFGACLCSQISYSFSPIGVQTYTERATKDDVQIATGALYLSHYHKDFNQAFYTLDLKYNKKISPKSRFVLDGFALLQVEGDGTSSYSLKELYYTNELSSKLTYFVGRKIVNWSNLENYLPIGFWNNAWDFNKSAPVKEGLLGAFLKYKVTKNTKLEFFASPISIPKATSHYKFSDEGLVEANTLWFTPPPEKVDYEGDEYAAKYFIDLDIANLVLEPQVGFNLDWKNKNLFMKTSYLYGPSKDIDMAIDFSLNATSPDTNVDVFVTPKRVNVHKGTVEVGTTWGANGKTTASLSYRKRISDLLEDPAGKESYIGTSSGGIYQLAHEQHFLDKKLKALVHFVENTTIENKATGELDEFLLSSLLVPFRYRRGVGTSLEYKIGSKVKTSLYGYYDTKLDGAMGDLKVDFILNKVLVSVGYNFVEALSADSKEFYKDFRENDSYHMGVSYVF